MAKPTLTNVLGAISDPLLLDNYSLVIVPPTGLTGVQGTVFSNALTIQCKSTEKPGSSIQAVEVALFGQVLLHAGQKTFSHDMASVYVENRTMTIYKLLEQWSELCKSHSTQTGGYKNEYSTTAVLSIFDQKNVLVASYKVFGIWIAELPAVSFDGTTSTAMEVSVTWKYDYYETIS